MKSQNFYLFVISTIFLFVRVFCSNQHAHDRFGSREDLSVGVARRLHEQQKLGGALRSHGVKTNIKKESVTDSNLSVAAKAQPGSTRWAGSYHKYTGKYPVYSGYASFSHNKLLFCWIPKNSCTIFKKLFYAEAGIDISSYANFSTVHTFNVKWPKAGRNFQKTLDDPTVNHVVFIRDPLEKFVSAWINKCASVRSTAWCKHMSIVEVLEELYQKRLAGEYCPHKPNLMDHFVPQYCFCSIPDDLSKWNIYLFNKHTREAQINKFLHDQDLMDYKYIFKKHSRSHNLKQSNNARDSIKLDKEAFRKFKEVFGDDYRIYFNKEPEDLDFHRFRRFVMEETLLRRL